jgi:uncharacterized protein (TIGR00661 family)
MGHAIRSGAVLDELLARGHDVRVVTSGGAYEYLAHHSEHVHEIWGLSFAKDGADIQMLQSVIMNLRGAVTGWPSDLKKYFRLIEDFMPEVVISDFESFSVLFAQRHRKRIVSLDNIQMIDRCRHDGELVKGYRDDFHIARTFIATKVPRAFQYIVATFFYPPLRRKRTTLVPSILRPAILGAERERGDHLLVYWAGDETVPAILKAAGVPCRIYGMRRGIEDDIVDGCLTYRSFSDAGFVDDLRTCRGLITGGGFSLLSEAVYLHKPILSIPLAGQAEQQLNARYLARLGFGQFAQSLTAEVLEEFLASLPALEESISTYEQDGNTVMIETLERNLEAAVVAPRRLSRKKTAGGGETAADA